MISMDIISPHRDDAALSICHMMDKLADAGGTFRIVSCFTLSAWAPRLGTGLGMEQVSLLRKREDEGFVAQYNDAGEVYALDLLDAPLRPDWVIEGRDAVQQAYGQESEMVRLVATALSKVNTHNKMWAVPLAVGHRDHLICLWAGIATAATVPLIIYEDMPYALQLSSNELAAQVQLVGTRLKRLFTPFQVGRDFSVDKWVNRLSCYASQYSVDELRDIAERLKSRGGERIWADKKAMQDLQTLA